MITCSLLRNTSSQMWVAIGTILTARTRTAARSLRVNRWLEGRSCPASEGCRQVQGGSSRRPSRQSPGNAFLTEGSADSSLKQRGTPKGKILSSGDEFGSAKLAERAGRHDIVNRVRTKCSARSVTLQRSVSTSW
jgi:hypothetical protein